MAISTSMKVKPAGAYIKFLNNIGLLLIMLP
jgi:hypothetical protein